jgi:cell division protein FtsL
MKRAVIIVSVLLLGLLVVGSYRLENAVETMHRQLGELDTAYLQEERNLQVLKAEWSFLNQPERLQEMAMRHVDRFGLQPIAPSQTGSLDELPMRPEPPVDDDAGDGWDAVAGLPRPAFKPALPSSLFLASSERPQ